MPTATELQETGRQDLASAIRRYGGWEQCAKEADLILSSISRPRSLYLTYCTKLAPGKIMKRHKYWTEFDNLRKELVLFSQQHMNQHDDVNSDRLQMPNMTLLENNGRHDLARAIRKHGGTYEVAKRLDLKSQYYSRAYWKDFENVKTVRTYNLQLSQCTESLRLGIFGLRMEAMSCA